MEISLSQAITKYQNEEYTSKKLLSEIMLTAQYLDIIYSKLKSDPMGAVVLKKIEADMECDYGLNRQISQEDTKKLMYIIFKDKVPFAGKYTEIYVESLDKAEEQAIEFYAEFWDYVTDDSSVVSGLEKV